MTFTPFWKSEFQKCLTQLNEKNNIVNWEEVSSELETQTHPIWEYVYRVHLRNPAVCILVYSSVYKQTDRAREVGSDAVRLVFEWKTKFGMKYFYLGKRYRVDKLFENLAADLIVAGTQCFKLPQEGWFVNLEDALSR